MEIALSPQTALDSSCRGLFLIPGTILQGRYRVLKRLGKGGMGAVYEAVDQRLDTVVALKETFSADEQLRRQFAQEAHLLARLQHPALPRVSDYFTEGDRAFLVMQFIGGPDLAEVIAAQPGPFPRLQVIAWADQLLDALVYLHTSERQVIHRDIKPHNLKITANGQIALLDFGLAKANASELSETKSAASIFGYTRRYSPLEQIQDQGTNPRSDIYALGATLYHLLTGVKPLDALTRATALAESKPDPLSRADEIHPAVGFEVASILRRAMAVNPQERFESASEFREALRRMGRKDAQLAQDGSRRSAAFATESEIRRSLASSKDPFVSYSILRPDELADQNRKSRLPMIVALATVMLAVIGGISFADPGWIDSASSLLNYSRVSSQTREQAALESDHKDKWEKPRPTANTNTNFSAAGATVAVRRNEKAKRRSSRSETSHQKFPRVTPPPISIIP